MDWHAGRWPAAICEWRVHARHRATGLPDNSITQLLEDKDGNLWGGTYAGIFRAAKKDLINLAAGTIDEIAFSVYGRFDGLPAQSYSGWFSAVVLAFT
ncbi:MAG: two-component regulator propeller domain-containing protein [Limisphaerales bacterium]